MASSTAVLERAPIEIPDSPAALFRLWESTSQAVRAMPQAAVIFAVLGIAPFTAASVEAYKKAQIERVQHQKRIRTALQIIAALVGLVGLLYFLPLLGRFNQLCGLGSSVLLFYGFNGLVRNIGESWTWKAVPIAYYGHPIPDSVRLAERRIAAVCPTATFKVEYLEHTKDPFLVVEFNEDGCRHYEDGCRHYVAAWDECRLDAPLMA